MPANEPRTLIEKAYTMRAQMHYSETSRLEHPTQFFVVQINPVLLLLQSFLSCYMNKYIRLQYIYTLAKTEYMLADFRVNPKK